MDEEVSILVCKLEKQMSNINEQTAAIFLEGGVKLRQFVPVKLHLESGHLQC